MEGADALGLIAEVGIAIVGFAGVIATLRASGGRMDAYPAFRISLLLGSSVEAVLLALLPFALHFAGLGSGVIWILSSCSMVLLLGMFQLVSYRVSRSALPAAPEDRSPAMRLVTYFSVPFLLSLSVLQIANAAFFQELWPFYVGLLALTAWSLFQFAYILFAPSRAEVTA